MVGAAIIFGNKMSSNAFQAYDQIRYTLARSCRSYQLHCHRMENRTVQVPTHQAFSPNKPKLEKVK